jgi:far upstream element-binding protein
MNSDKITEEILVPGQKCGLIIGKGGETIRKLQANSDTTMQLIQDSSTPSEQGKSLHITGLPDRVEFAKRMINQLLNGDDNRMPSGPATGANQIQMNQEVSTIGKFVVPRTAVGLIIGRGGEMIKRIASESGARVQFEQDDGSNPLECVACIDGSNSQIARATSMIRDLVNRSSAETQKPSITMLVPISKTGLVIGKGGEVIKKINRETGARVELSRDPPIDGVNNFFVIRGDPHQIESAKQAIFAQINNGDAPVSTQGGYQQGAQNQWNPANVYGQGQQASNQNSVFGQPAAYDQSSFGSSQLLSAQSQYSNSQQQHGGQLQPSINPTTGQQDYSAQWIEYYRSVGMHDEADEVERALASRNRQ